LTSKNETTHTEQRQVKVKTAAVQRFATELLSHAKLAWSLSSQCHRNVSTVPVGSCTEKIP